MDHSHLVDEFTTDFPSSSVSCAVKRKEEPFVARLDGSPQPTGGTRDVLLREESFGLSRGTVAVKGTTTFTLAASFACSANWRGKGTGDVFWFL